MIKRDHSASSTCFKDLKNILQVAVLLVAFASSQAAFGQQAKQKVDPMLQSSPEVVKAKAELQAKQASLKLEYYQLQLREHTLKSTPPSPERQTEEKKLFLDDAKLRVKDWKLRVEDAKLRAKDAQDYVFRCLEKQEEAEKRVDDLEKGIASK